MASEVCSFQWHSHFSTILFEEIQGGMNKSSVCHITEWLQKMSCGGLFCVGDQSYQFFRMIECWDQSTTTTAFVIRNLDKRIDMYMPFMKIRKWNSCGPCFLLTWRWYMWTANRNNWIVGHNRFSTTSSWLEQYKRSKEKTIITKNLWKSLAQWRMYEL